MRERIREYAKVYGSYDSWPHWTPPVNYEVDRGSTLVQDNPGPPGYDQYFYVRSLEHEGGTLSGTINPGWEAVCSGNCPTDRYPLINASLGTTGFPDIDESEFALRIMKAGNPSTPLLDVPNFVYELKDIPQALRIAGRTLIGKGANAYLSYQYGWAPLFRDMFKLDQFQSAYTARVKQLNNLRSRGFDVRKINLRHDSYLNPPQWVTADSSKHAIIDVLEQWSAERRIWGYSRWIADDFAAQADDSDIQARARNSLLGVQALGLATIWESLPWSWLIDWFANVGSILAANRNSVGATCSGVYMCVNTIKRVKTIDTNRPDVFTPFESISNEKERRSLPYSLVGQLNYLSGTQFAILGSLGIQRVKGL
jgi:hypothetical protein